MVTSDQLISIVTPAFNASSYVGRAIESVQAQSYPHWEMIIVDDRSSDGTGEIVKDYQRNDPRIRLILQPSNQGPANARNAALEESRGDMIAFLDSDDYWLPAKLAHQMRFMRETGTPLSYTQFRRISADGSTIGHVIQIPTSLTYRQLLQNSAIATSTAMVDRRQTGDFRMVKTYYDDFVLWLNLLKRGFVARGLHEDLMRYGVLTGSVSRNKLRSAYKTWRTFRDIERLNLLQSVYCLTGYALNGLRKYRKF